VDAADALRTEDDLKFILIGDGPEKHGLLQQARQRDVSNIRFLDPVPTAEMPELLAAADVVLVTLKMYIPGAVPSKLYEAMASGRPIVLVASGEAAEIVREHRAGIVVEPGDLAGLARALQTLRAQPYLRRTLGENGRRAAERHFDRAEIVTRFIEHLEANL
jgi:glycosyltransferase involved in cell wall biosynthesis